MKNIKQLRAISYAIARKKEKEAQQMLKECELRGINVEESLMPAVTIRRCQKALLKSCGGNNVKN